MWGWGGIYWRGIGQVRTKVAYGSKKVGKRENKKETLWNICMGDFHGFETQREAEGKVIPTVKQEKVSVFPRVGEARNDGRPSLIVGLDNEKWRRVPRSTEYGSFGPHKG